MPELTEPQLEAMLDRAAERGACRALKRVGLNDDGAAHDIDDLRSLLTAWRDVCRNARATAVRIVVTAVLSAVMFAMGYGWWKGKWP